MQANSKNRVYLYEEPLRYCDSLSLSMSKRNITYFFESALFNP